MKVENIRSNYVGNRYQPAKTTPNFTGIRTTTIKSTEEILKEILPNRKALNFINKFEKLRGELGGILITAVGTGLVAPFSIAFNPFVKAKPDATEEEKEELSKTKKYTAMRQPISAVLAALFQAGALGPIDRFLDRISNDSQFSKNIWLELDQSAIQKKEYIERGIKKEMKKEPAASKMDSKEFKAELDKRVKAKQDEQLGNIADSIRDTNQIRIGERALPDKEVAEYINHQANEYIKDAQALQLDEKGLSFYTQRATTLMENKELLGTILSEEKLNGLKSNPRELKNYLLSLRDNPENVGIQKILDEIITAPDQIRESRCFRTIDRIRRINEACGGNFTPEKYLEKLLERNDLLDEKIAAITGAKINDLSQVNTETIKTSLEKLTKACLYNSESSAARDIYENTNTFQDDIAKLGAKIRKDIAKRYKEVLEHKYKGFSQISKVIIGVFITLPITCTVLNWVYPRFMAKFFPNLAKTNKPEENKNGGDK